MDQYRADLHVHSRYSRATSKGLTPRHLAAWARVKGLDVVATGDFTHPKWLEELKDQLVPDGHGLLALKDPAGLEAEIPWLSGYPMPGRAKFMLSAEISSIYKRGGRVRKVHNLVYVPTFEAAEKLNAKLSRVGNLASDGRPILGLDSRHLLEMVLETDPYAYLVPAHIWTPWFSLFGSKSGFDSVEECFGPLSEHVFALETGLSSDPEMNRLLSSLDRYRLVSNSDAHSGEKLGREANLFSGEVSFDGIYRALRGEGVGHDFLGTVEFFPEEGKYHLDGHSACGVVMDPQETRAKSGVCPVCGKPLTVGVLHRVMELADREQPIAPQGQPGFVSLIPLCEVLGEIHGAGAGSKKVLAHMARLLGRLGPELSILSETPLEDLSRDSPVLAEAVSRMRRGQVFREPGFDGQYGRIRAFSPEELSRMVRGAALVSVPQGAPEATGGQGRKTARRRRKDPSRGGLLDVAPGAPGTGRAAPEGHGPTGPGAADVGARVAGTDAPPPGPLGTGGARMARNGAATPGAPPGPGAEAAAPPPPLASLNERQRHAATGKDQRVLVLAGPGTGKTHTLLARIRHLLEMGADPRSILVVTFTRRAAQELKDRLGDAPVRADTLHALAHEYWTDAYGEKPVLLSEEAARRLYAEVNPELTGPKLKQAWQQLTIDRERMRRRPLPVWPASPGEARPDADDSSPPEADAALGSAGHHAPAPPGDGAASSPGEPNAHALLAKEHLDGARTSFSMPHPAVMAVKAASTGASGQNGGTALPARDAVPDSMPIPADISGRPLSMALPGALEPGAGPPPGFAGRDRRFMNADASGGGSRQPDPVREASAQGPESSPPSPGSAARPPEAAPPEDLASRYARQKASWNLADYTDLLEFWLEKIETGIYAPRFKHVLVDEVQDLSPLQLAIVRSLSDTPGCSFFAIGDPNQSIYGFRGAVSDARRELQGFWPELSVITLSENYRSTQAILDLSGGLFPRQDGLTAIKDAGRGEIMEFTAPQGLREVSWMAEKIRQMLGPTSHTLTKGRGSSLSPGDIAILVRFKGLMEPIRKVLDRFGVPCSVPEEEAFWADSRVKAILNAAGRFLGMAGMEGALTLACPDRVLAKGPKEIAFYLRDVPPFDHLFWQSPEFGELVSAYSKYGGWAGLLSHVNGQSELELVGRRAEKVRIMTLHAAKGLEFEAVFLPALEDGILPFAGMARLTGKLSPSEIPPDEAEEERLFYVGLTRAKSRLYLSHAEKRELYGRLLMLKKSRFLKKLDLDAVRRSHLVARTVRKEKQLDLI